MEQKDRTWLCTVVVADIVGFAKKSVEEQTRTKSHFAEVAQCFLKDIPEFDRIMIDTGDGAAICFMGDPEDAYNVAMSICSAINDESDDSPEYNIRTAINLGPVRIVEDVNGKINALGDGINVGARLIEFAQPGKLVASRSFVEVLSRVAEKYSDMFKSSGDRSDKHGRLHEVFTLSTSVGAIVADDSVHDALPSIAVLPFIDLSPERDQDYFCEGVAEEIIGVLSMIDGLVVVSRTSSFRFKDSKEDIRDIARQLSVATILEGSVRKSGDKLRITAQLINASTGFHLWTEQYDREMKDVFAIQDEIAHTIAEKLKIDLEVSEPVLQLKSQTSNTKAHDLYLMGRYVQKSRSGSGLENGIAYFEQAIKEDPEFALSYAGLADSYNLMAFYHLLAPSDAFPKAKAATLKALDLDEKLAEAHSSLAVINFYYEWDWVGAEREFKRALELNPQEDWGLHIYAEMLGALGRLDEAEECVQRTIRLDPLSPTKNALVGWNHIFNRRYDNAIEHLERSIVLNPEYLFLNVFLSSAYFATARYQDAIWHLSEAVAHSKDDQALLALLSYAYSKSGDLDRGCSHHNSLHQLAADRYVSSFYIAVTLMGLGHTAKSLEALDHAVTERCPQLVFLAADPLFDDLRSEPRFQKILERVGLPAQLASDVSGF